MSREEISNEYTWDLSSLYKEKSEWESDISLVKEKLDEIVKYRGSLSENAKNVFEALKLDLEIDRILQNIYTYSKMRLDENTENDEYQQMVDKAQSLSVKASEETSFILPEIISADEDKIKEFMKNEDYKVYSHYVENILRSKSHTLVEGEEKLLAAAGELYASPYQIYSMINDADLRFPKVKDEKGNQIELTHGNFITFMESEDRSVRREAFNALYETYKSFKNTFAMALSSEIKKNYFYSKSRKYGSSLEASLHSDNIPVKVYENLISTVGKNTDKMHKYVNIRKKALNLDEIHMYDLYTPMVKDLDIKIDYKEASEILIKGLSSLGSDYVSIVKKGLDSRWVDIYENRGKRSGAYSWGTYDSDPFILMNYTDTLDSVFTLAHEMGHSVHSHYTRSAQPYVYGGYSIFLAEIASTVNETILINYLIKNTDDKLKKKYYLNHYLEQFRGTIYRQTMFAEFEKLIHERVESGESLSAESLSNIYVQLNKKYYGKDIVLDSGIEVEWARIPHFYYNFYVYQYSTGFSAAIYFAKKIIEKDQKAIDSYIEFLKSGSSDYPTEILKRAGIDMTSSEPIEKALELFGDLLNEYEKLI